MNSAPENWKIARADIFWGELAPANHILQIYETDEVFLDTLTGFVLSGLHAGDCIIIIASSEHILSLDELLSRNGIDINAIKEDDRYIVVDAETILASFMKNDWPDEELFRKSISSLIERGTCRNRKIKPLEKWWPYYGVRERTALLFNWNIYGIS